MKKFLSFAAYALFAVFVTLSFSACGSDDDDDVKVPVSGNGTNNGHAYVDLGLPSGLKWATCNVGADKPQACGSYFAWGETTVKSNYDWSTYKWGTASNLLTKYCSKSDNGLNGFTDTKTILNLADDAARANWGGQWRMPTKADFEELKNNTNSEWVYDYNGTGVAGRRFTADNGNHIFLPVTGYRNGTSLHNTADGYYWSSSLSTDDPDIAYELNVNNHVVQVQTDGRERGKPVRPVLP